MLPHLSFCTHGKKHIKIIRKLKGKIIKTKIQQIKTTTLA